MCGITQSIPLLSIGYNPTPADIETLNQMSQAITVVAQMDREKLTNLNNRIEEAKQNPSLTDNDRSNYIITAIDDMIEQAKILY